MFQFATPQKIDFLCRTLAVIIGSLFSPVWMLSKNALQPYMDIDSLLKGKDVLVVLMDYIGNVEQLGSARVFTHLVPSLVGCLIAALVFFILCNWLGGITAKYFVRRLNLTQPA